MQRLPMEAVLAQMDFLEVAVMGESTDQATGQQAARCRLRRRHFLPQPFGHRLNCVCASTGATGCPPTIRALFHRVLILSSNVLSCAASSFTCGCLNIAAVRPGVRRTVNAP